MDVLNRENLWHRYRDLQRFVGWSDEDATHVACVAAAVTDKDLAEIVEDFYGELLRHPPLARVLNGGHDQMQRLKRGLHKWLTQLLSGDYDELYVIERWRVGLRHVEIGLEQVYASAAMSRLRAALVERLQRHWKDPVEDLCTVLQSLDKLIDLDLAVIEDAYEWELLRLTKLAERERSELKFQNLVEAAACMIVILRADHRIAYFSPFAEKLTGSAQRDVLGKNFVEVFVPVEHRAETIEQIEKAHRGEPMMHYEHPILCADGVDRWLVWNARPLHDFEGAPVTLAVGHDITERRQAAAQLLQSERLAAIGETIAGLAHESRNALQRVHSCTEMLEFEVEGNEEAMALIRRSQRAQEDLHRLFDEVRNFAAPISLEFTSFHLRSIWREAWALLSEERRGRDAILSEEILCDSTIEGDRFRLTQVFRNLLENSLAACRDPVQIHILCRPRSGAEKERLEIIVRDNGPGLDSIAKQRVFEPFFTTKSKGTGLGMAIAHRVIESHGGRIYAGGLRGEGAEFIIVVPHQQSHE